MRDMGTEPTRLETAQLRDGRTLAYATYGDPEGPPVFYFHGFPGSRLEPATGHDDMLKAGARVIAIDRPGFGRSTPKPGRRFLDWPRDVTELADQLGLERFAAMGVSGGGPYAAACAHEIPDRLTHVAIVCGVGPFDVPEATEGMMPRNRMLFTVARYSQLLPRLAMWAMVRSMRGDPEKVIEGMKKALPEADVEIMSDPARRDVFVEGAQESLVQGTRAAGYECQLYSRNWGFRLEDIARQVHLFQGEQDRNVPPSMGRYQAQALPDCRSHFYSDEGHISLVMNRLDEILGALLAPA